MTVDAQLRLDDQIEEERKENSAASLSELARKLDNLSLQMQSSSDAAASQPHGLINAVSAPTDNTFRAQDSQRRPQYQRFSGSCYNCGRQGHMARDCRSPRQRFSARCYACGRVGHYARECRARSPPSRGFSRNRASFRDRRDSSRRQSPYERRPRRDYDRRNSRPRNSRRMSRDRDDQSSRSNSREGRDNQREYYGSNMGAVYDPYEQFDPFCGMVAPETDECVISQWNGFSCGSFFAKARALVYLLMFMLAFFPASHAVNPLLCHEGLGSTVWKLPESPQCDANFSTLNEDSPRKVTYMLYKYNEIQYKTPAFVCSKRRDIVRTFVYFFNDERLKEEESFSVPVTEDECERMVRFHMCSEGALVQVDGLWQTQNVVPWSYSYAGFSCCRWHEFSATNCFFYQSSVLKRHAHTLMESPAGDVAHCDYTKGHCALHDSKFLQWKPDALERCAYLEWKTLIGHQWGSNWISKDNNLALTFRAVVSKRDCDLNDLVISDQGIPVRELAQMSKRSRHGRMVESLTTDGLAVVGAEQLAASLQALEFRSRENLRFAFTHAFATACDLMKAQVQTLRAVLQDSPTLAVRQLLKNDNLYAQSSSNFIEV